MNSHQFTQVSQPYPSKKEKKIKKQPHNKRTTREKAKEVSNKFWLCASCSNRKVAQKRYMSYPALYTHVKQKHKGQEIHFQKMGLQIATHSQRQKSKKMFNIVDPVERGELERGLIEEIMMVKLKLVKYLVKGKKIDKTLIGDKDTDDKVRQVRLQAKVLGNQMGISARILSSMETQTIFREYYGRFGMISFGGDIVRFFCRNGDTAAKLQLQLSLLDARDTLLIDEKQFLKYSIQLWGASGKEMGLISEGWGKWKAVEKSMLLHDYSEIDSAEHSI